MQHQFKVTETFQKDIKWLKKKYPNVLKDLSETLATIDNNFGVVQNKLNYACPI